MPLDWDGPAPDADSEDSMAETGIIVPDIELPLEEHQAQAVCSRINPLQNSAIFSIEYYVQLRTDILEQIP